MKKIDYLNRIMDMLKNPSKEALNMSLTDVHHKGLFSLVLSGNRNGKLTRVFIANKKIAPFSIQLHTHRYPIKLTTLGGNIKHFVADLTENKNCSTVSLSEFDYKSPLNGGSGLKYNCERGVIIKDYSLPIGSTLNMDCKEFHTVSCSKGSVWIVEEGGFEVESSKVLGVPFTLNNLYNQPKQFEVNDNFQLVKRLLGKIILEYNSLVKERN